QQLKLLRYQEGGEIAYPCDVPAGSIETGDKPKLDGIGPSLEHDRNRRGRSPGRERGDDCWCCDHGHLTADQVGRQRRQSVILAFRPAVLDCHVLPLDIAGFLETFTEGGHQERVSPGRSAAEESDHRLRRLLRAPRTATRPPCRPGA